MKIALVTYQDHNAYHNQGVNNEDDNLIEFLDKKGLQIVKEIWNDPAVKWETYDLVLIKSTWDYFNLITDFYAWLDMLASLSVKVLNPLHIVKWNADKHYLEDIERAGLNVTPTIFIKKGTKTSLEEVLNQFGTARLIIKPTVSGGSKNTIQVTNDNITAAQKQLEAYLETEDYMIQPFLQEIEQEGEWSFIFFGSEFSHALLKKAKAGDFRVQSSFGGTVHPQNPAQNLLDSAQAYVNQFAKNCLYARVDGTIVNGELMLMELELIEPFLFLDTDECRMERYYLALQKSL